MSILENREKDLVSVVISTYNYQRYILDALTALARQTYPAIEIILVDDCSTDGTRGLVRGWLQKNKRFFTDFIYLQLPRNCYSSWALNIGFLVSNGEFIVIHDADDISYDLKIEKQVQWLRDHPETAAVGTSFWAIEGGVNYKPFWLSYDRQEITLNYKENNKHCVSFGTLMFRAEILKDVIGVKKNSDKLNDYIFLKDIVNNEYIVDNLEESLMVIRLHPGQLSEKYLKNFTESIPISEGCFRKIRGRVSVLIPIRDSSGNIIRVLDSITGQIYPEIEVIIVDDYTHKNIEEKVLIWYTEYQKKYPAGVIKELLYFSLPDFLEFPWDYNIASYLAKGEYILYQKDKETVNRNIIQSEVEFLENNQDYHAVITEFEGKSSINNLLLKASVIDQSAGFGRVENPGFLPLLYILHQKGYNYKVLADQSKG